MAAEREREEGEWAGFVYLSPGQVGTMAELPE